ncbi:MAG: hypothetical protein QM520_01610 [Gammaproteobacteria bacterium]|nr:hypothetical protein [Gammaproteobacteria bacterium]MDI9335717.1 hypothetical protein [Gammaproteobacteria bacterium]
MWSKFSKFIKGILALSEQEMNDISEMGEMYRKYPSMRVTERGRISIDPKDIFADIDRNEKRKLEEKLQKQNLDPTKKLMDS